MNYKIVKLNRFKVCGISTLLTTFQNKNLEISKKFWVIFNKKLRYNKISQGDIWCKYAFTYKKDNNYFYYCAVPYYEVVPVGFEIKEIEESYYLVFEHIGKIDNIKNNISYIYKEFLPLNCFEISKKQFFHFEKYDYRFKWNHPNSVIEIYLPIKYELTTKIYK
ncbi:MAG: effector binding domain-containing protein [Halanaerobiales bacterium]|nr:effector binding domain-containing protein [Halanaerobiales bacterium]